MMTEEASRRNLRVWGKMGMGYVYIDRIWGNSMLYFLLVGWLK